MNWLVDGVALGEKPRQGGAHALKGFSFQAGIALVRLTWLLTCRHRIIRLRYDGAQDIDLKFVGGEEVYIQAKNYGQGNFTLQHFYQTLAGFSRDIISAQKLNSKAPQPSFHLMLTAIPTQDSAMELIRRKRLSVHGREVVANISIRYRGGLKDDELLRIAEGLLKETQYFISDIGNPNDTLLAIAGMELVNFGILPEHVDAALDHLLQRLQAGESYYIEDVAESINAYVPPAHPAHPFGAMRLLPGKAHLPPLSTVRNDFFQGQPVLWHAIAHDLDVLRPELKAVQHDVLSHMHIGGMVVVAGPTGSGKSSLIHRAAWNLHHEGQIIAIHVKFPDKAGKEEWQNIRKLRQLTKRPILLIVDDVWRHTSFLDVFETYSSNGIFLLGSSRPNEFPVSLPSYGLWRHNLGTLSPSVALELALKLGVPERPVGKGLSGFLASGQIFALSLHLQNSSLTALATNTLNSLSTGGVELYLDLCLGGMFDLPTPKALVILRAKTFSVSWPEKSLQGLVFNREGKNDLLQVGHAMLANAVIEHAEDDPIARALDLAELCTHENSTSRSYAIKLLRFITNKFNASATTSVDRIIYQAKRLAEKAEFADSYSLEAMLISVGAKDAADAIISKTNFSEAHTVRDVSLLISLAEKNNFEAAYPILISYYRKKQSLAGLKRFIYLVRRHGGEQELDELAELADKWLAALDFPDHETIATFDMLALGPKSVLRKHVHVVNEYISRCKLKNRDLTLAVIRLSITAKIETIAIAVFDAALEALNSGQLMHDQNVVHQLAKLANTRLAHDAARCSASYKLLLENMPLNGSEIDHFLVRTLAHSTPKAEIEKLLKTINTWPVTGLNKRKRSNIEHTLRVLARRNASDDK